MLSNFLIILVIKEKTKLKLAPAIPIGAPTTLAEEIIQINKEIIQTPFVTERKIKILSI